MNQELTQREVLIRTAFWEQSSREGIRRLKGYAESDRMWDHVVHEAQVAKCGCVVMLSCNVCCDYGVCQDIGRHASDGWMAAFPAGVCEHHWQRLLADAGYSVQHLCRDLMVDFRKGAIRYFTGVAVGPALDRYEEDDWAEEDDDEEDY